MSADHVLWCCDNREHGLIPLLAGAKVKALPVGDIWIGLSGETVAPAGIVAERKTAADLEASVLDGRYQEQRLRLLTFCNQTGARPLYIIEGTLDRMTGKFTQETLQKFLTRLQLRYGVPVMQTDSLEDTARLCCILRDQIAKEPTVFQPQDGAQKSYTHTISVVKRGNMDAANFASATLQSCPGISAPVADAILAACGGTFAGVWAATEKELADVRVSEKRRVGPAVAKRLLGLLHGGAGVSAD